MSLTWQELKTKGGDLLESKPEGITDDEWIIVLARAYIQSLRNRLGDAPSRLAADAPAYDSIQGIIGCLLKTFHHRFE